MIPSLALALAGALMGHTEQEKEWSPPPYKQLRYDEDYTYLQDPTKRLDFFDPIKYVPFGAPKGRYLSVGGEVRPYFEFFRNEEWGSFPGDDGYLLQRYMLHLDVHWNERTRMFGQLKSGIETGRRSGPRPAIDEDKLGVHQAFLDVAVVSSPARSLTLRFGRQEMSFGHQRLVNYREGPNLRRSFDGLRATFQAKAWKVDAFATKPVQNKPGFFDDPPDPERNFWGVYATRALTKPLSVDFYYLGLTSKDAEYDQGIANETRHTNGARLWGASAGWDYDVELIYQWGKFGEGDIRAWAVAPVFGYTFHGLRSTPRLALSLDVHSGDEDPNDADLETYHPLYPKGAYYGLLGPPFGPSNHWEIHPILEMQLSKRVWTRADWLLYWRLSHRDGVYGLVGGLLRTGQLSDAAFVGHTPGVEVVVSIDRHWEMTGQFSRFFVGRFLRETPPGEDMTYVALWLTLKF